MTTLLFPLLFIIGASFGSFLNVVALRFISKKDIVFTSSFCPVCKKKLSWKELVPIISFSVQGGACSGCKAPISAQYPIVEFVFGMITMLVIGSMQFADVPPMARVLLLGIAAVLIVLYVIDYRTFLLPDFFIVLLSVLVVLFLAVHSSVSPLTHFLGSITGSGALLALWLATHGKGIGFGDVKLLVPLGMLFGVIGVVTVLFISFMAGGFVGAYLLASKKATPKTAVPFGPYLVGAALLLLVWPNLPAHMLRLLGW